MFFVGKLQAVRRKMHMNKRLTADRFIKRLRERYEVFTK